MDPFFKKSKQGTPSPFMMAANQGNWRALEVILRSMKQSLSIERDNAVLSAELLSAFSDSTCVPCLHGGQKCTRCAMDRPHSKQANFENCIDVMFKYGSGVCQRHNMQTFSQNQAKTSIYKHFPSLSWIEQKPLNQVRFRSTQSLLCQPVIQQHQEDTTSSRESPETLESMPARSRPQLPTIQQDNTQSCSNCGKSAGPDGKLKICSGCHRVRYCSRECQIEDRKKQHKSQCKK